MRFTHLNDWLNWQENLNPAEIDLGLDRVSFVLSQAGLPSTFNCPLITVAGTNGKGSVVAMLEAMALSTGLKVCSYTSPHLFQYNERIKINEEAVSDDVLCESFEHIDQARGDIELTYFEFGTLAAINIFFDEQPDLVILEVGLGGRLDAVNVMDADVSVLTSISIDHVDWLGDDRESIGFEKVGVARFSKTLICGDYSPPVSVIEHANRLKCNFLQIGRDYKVVKNNVDTSWRLDSCYYDVPSLPEPSLYGTFQRENAASAIVALQTLQSEGLLQLRQANVSEELFKDSLLVGLREIKLLGRFQQVSLQPRVFVDVAHNPHSAKGLLSQISTLPKSADNKIWAIVAMLADKDVKGVLQQVATEIDCWCFAGLANITRGLKVEKLSELASEMEINKCTIRAETVSDACELVLSKASKNDYVIIFGSFYTASEAMQFFNINKNKHVN